MRGKTSRGHSLLLLVALLGAVASVGAAVAVRLSVELDSRRAEDRRVQALWLGRTAAARAVPEKLQIWLGNDLAQVTTTVDGQAGKKAVSTVVVPRHGTATVEVLFGKTGAPVIWRERYDR